MAANSTPTGRGQSTVHTRCYRRHRPGTPGTGKGGNLPQRLLGRHSSVRSQLNLVGSRLSMPQNPPQPAKLIRLLTFNRELYRLRHTGVKQKKPRQAETRRFSPTGNRPQFISFQLIAGHLNLPLPWVSTEDRRLRVPILPVTTLWFLALSVG